MNAYIILAHNPVQTHLDPTIVAVTQVIIKSVQTAMVGLRNVCVNCLISYITRCKRVLIKWRSWSLSTHVY